MGFWQYFSLWLTNGRTTTTTDLTHSNQVFLYDLFLSIFKDFLHIHTVAVPVQLYVRSADLC